MVILIVRSSIPKWRIFIMDFYHISTTFTKKGKKEEKNEIEEEREGWASEKEREKKRNCDWMLIVIPSSMLDNVYIPFPIIQ